MHFGGAFVGLSLLCSVIAVEVPQLSRPVINNVMGKYLNHPGLAFHPKLDPPSTLIRFNKARESTYTPYTNALTEALSAYENANQIGDWVIDCSHIGGYRPSDLWNYACLFDLSELGPDCIQQQAFGYEDGQPCVLFNLERVFRWLPEPYSNDTVPDNIRNLWSEYFVTLKCEGADASSRDNIGRLRYYPKNGFHFRYFPEMDASTWKPPLVFVRFETPCPGVLVRVECKVYAKNIWHSSVLSTGMVSFELLVD